MYYRTGEWSSLPFFPCAAATAAAADGPWLRCPARSLIRPSIRLSVRPTDRRAGNKLSIRRFGLSSVRPSVHLHFGLSQTCITARRPHARPTNGRTDGRMDGRTDEGQLAKNGDRRQTESASPADDRLLQRCCCRRSGRLKDGESETETD